MKKIILLVGVALLFLAATAQNGNIQQHAPKQRLKSELADSMRRKGMGQAPDTTKDLMYNDRGPRIDVEKAPVGTTPKKTAK